MRQQLFVLFLEAGHFNLTSLNREGEVIDLDADGFVDLDAFALQDDVAGCFHQTPQLCYRTD